YLQYVDGVSATASGLRTLPLVAGLLVMSMVSGSVVSRTGQYKIFPVVGSAVMALGMFLLSRVGVATPYWQLAAAMLLLGIGIGLRDARGVPGSDTGGPGRVLGRAVPQAGTAAWHGPRHRTRRRRRLRGARGSRRQPAAAGRDRAPGATQGTHRAAPGQRAVG